MRIGVVGPTHPIKGGVSQHTTVLAQRLQAAGHDVEIVSWYRHYPTALYPGRQTVVVAEHQPFSTVRRTLSWARPDTWIREARRLRTFDLVAFAHVTPIQSIAYRCMLALLRRSPARTVVICHNVLPHERRRSDRLLARSLLNAADAVMTHSAAELVTARSLTSTPLTMATIAPFMPDAFAATALRGEVHRRLLFFGLVRPYKGLDVLLRAVATVAPPVALRVAGEFWGGTDATVDLCRDLGIDDRVQLLDDYVAADRVPALFEDVDALVVPYRSATGSQAVATAFRFGVPVIASDLPAFSPFVRDGVDGILVEPDDPERLARAIERLYSDATLEQLRSGVSPVDEDALWHDYLSALLSSAPEPSLDESADHGG